MKRVKEEEMGEETERWLGWWKRSEWEGAECVSVSDAQLLSTSPCVVVLSGWVGARTKAVGVFFLF